MTGMNSPSWMSLLWFGVVLALIPAALWLVKRSGLAPAGLRGAAAGPRLTGSLVLGPQQRVVTVEVGEGPERCWLVLGVTAQQITTLHTLAAPPTAPAMGHAASGHVPSMAPPGFSQVLSNALRSARRSDPPHGTPPLSTVAVPPSAARRPRAVVPGAEHDL